MRAIRLHSSGFLLALVGLTGIDCGGGASPPSTSTPGKSDSGVVGTYDSAPDRTLGDAPGTCQSSTCDAAPCAPKTDTQWCQESGQTCGTFAAQDCGATRVVDCGPCPQIRDGAAPDTYAAECNNGCPSDDTCRPDGRCVGGNLNNLTFDVRTLEVAGKVTLNGESPLSTSSACTPTEAGFGRGTLSMQDAAKGYHFEFPLQGCTSSPATFAGSVLPGTYRVAVLGQASNLPPSSVVVDPALVVASPASTLAFDVRTLAIAGTVTLNGTSPLSTSGDCSAAGFGRGSVSFHDAANGYSFALSLAGCTNSPATFNGSIFPGTYRVSVQGDASDLPQKSVIVAPALVVLGDIGTLNFDVKTAAIAGKVTLNGQNPLSTSSNCSSTSFERGSVSLDDAESGYHFSFPLQGCTSSPATFNGSIFPGTYRVSVVGGKSDLPKSREVVNPALAVTGDVASLTLDVKTVAIAGKVTLNGANPLSTSTACSATDFRRGSVSLHDAANGYDFVLELQGCTNALASFAGDVFPGTYRVSVVGGESDLPKSSVVVDPALAITGSASSLSLDVKTLSIAGLVTLNGANPLSTSSSCTATSFERGSVSLHDATHGYDFVFALQGCTSSPASFAGTVFPGIYRVSVSGSESDLPKAGAVVNPALAITSAVPSLAFDVKTVPIAGKVTLNDANPLSTSTNCGATSFRRGVVSLHDLANGYDFKLPIEGCTNTVATFAGSVFPGTYRVSVVGTDSDLPKDGAILVEQLEVP